MANPGDGKSGNCTPSSLAKDFRPSSNEEINVRYWEKLNFSPAKCLDPPHDVVSLSEYSRSTTVHQGRCYRNPSVSRLITGITWDYWLRLGTISYNDLQVPCVIKCRIWSNQKQSAMEKRSSQSSALSIVYTGLGHFPPGHFPRTFPPGAKC